MIIRLSTINGVTGNGGYKLGVKALITKIKLRNTMIIREIRERRQRENKNDCNGLLLASVLSPCPFIIGASPW